LNTISDCPVQAAWRKIFTAKTCQIVKIPADIREHTFYRLIYWIMQSIVQKIPRPGWSSGKNSGAEMNREIEKKNRAC
jgi:hypothetical protein